MRSQLPSTHSLRAKGASPRPSGTDGRRRKAGPSAAGLGARGRGGEDTGTDAPLLARSARLELLDGVAGQIEEIRYQLIVQMKRMAEIQEQVEEARLCIRELTGRPRPRVT